MCAWEVGLAWFFLATMWICEIVKTKLKMNDAANVSMGTYVAVRMPTDCYGGGTELWID